ncbi:hypothetical protein ABT56_22065 [Photobacterium aquae]|uniref:PPM-type phosphatase domain-containing protein n=1 Tax=Photobacterium aquae TaxID=1195763 RepID=A0A0J1GNX7_9GAMM|nr:PP2C family serine/threonine-protein phosphatase [Photobacterium aquae]KLV01450.1 hypothetical protein ABT56_22065 [Photobacterium aquae]
MTGYYLPLLPPVLSSRFNPPELSPVIDLSQWNAAAEAVVGYRHRIDQQPCQDAALAKSATRPHLVVSDGAGSAPVSELGSQVLVSGLSRLITTVEPLFKTWLDEPVKDKAVTAEATELLAQLIARHAKGVLKDIAADHKRSEKDYRATLLVCVLGQYRSFWLQVGDGYLVIRNSDTQDKKTNRWKIISPPDKGEFANQTCFVDDRLSLGQVQSGMLDSAGLTGVAAMSDGAAERLINLKNGEVANGLDHISRWLEQDDQIEKSLYSFLCDPGIWNATTGDDKSLAVLAASSAAQREEESR